MKIFNQTIIVLFVSLFTIGFVSAAEIDTNNNISTNPSDQSRHHLLDKDKKSRKKVAPFREERLDSRHDRRSKLHNQLEGNN
ncbi:hypothetical protein FLM55_02910 [Francisella sp. Scap27]|uniref:hypothetical protein n=1 Tax=Francisella sp. Scap27 TaxID=2589986 RepID=UPI0015BB5606|nr:hypothetical protein [Francisella sp. Scap27]QLE78747.1 hypothetical protein FLM55_02910 [Francisella sp. Scap27]